MSAGTLWRQELFVNRYLGTCFALHSRRAFGQHRVLYLAGHVGRGLHIRGDGDGHADVSRDPGHVRPAGQDFQVAGNAHRGDVDIGDTIPRL